MLEDGQKAVDVDPNYFKALLRLGEAQVELGKSPKYTDTEIMDVGIKNLQKALCLCWKLGPGDKQFGQKQAFEKQISQQVLRGKKIRWYK